MNNRQFPAHGDVRLHIEGRLLVIEGYGPANLEAVLYYQRSVQGFRNQLNSGPWASLVLLREEPLLVPEAKNLLISSIQRATQQNLVATAVVIQDTQYESTVRMFWESIYAQVDLTQAFFEQEADARAWLQRHIDIASNGVSISK
ncbi:hypothetical protein [Alteromonas oceanisediminis]|uniref:hypothetical protein n=1 Tax=Alteromonas oceanisediminis TaxID=2836180 RepID=UPI001BDAFDDB|nr:hypothetical protein [Alteromonas oceanisediminis]MBT0585636.1 hypothetical protein [Alteromonas oceanisediminis]